MADAILVEETNIQKETNYIYYLDGECNVYRALRRHKNDEGLPPELVVKTSIVRDTEYIYYIKKDGNVYKSKAMRAGRQKKKVKCKKQ